MFQAFNSSTFMLVSITYKTVCVFAPNITVGFMHSPTAFFISLKVLKNVLQVKLNDYVLRPERVW